MSGELMILQNVTKNYKGIITALLLSALVFMLAGCSSNPKGLYVAGGKELNYIDLKGNATKQTPIGLSMNIENTANGSLKLIIYSDIKKYGRFKSIDITFLPEETAITKHNININKHNAEIITEYDDVESIVITTRRRKSRKKNIITEIVIDIDEQKNVDNVDFLYITEGPDKYINTLIPFYGKLNEFKRTYLEYGIGHKTYSSFYINNPSLDLNIDKKILVIYNGNAGKLKYKKLPDRLYAKDLFSLNNIIYVDIEQKIKGGMYVYVDEKGKKVSEPFEKYKRESFYNMYIFSKDEKSHGDYKLDLMVFDPKKHTWKRTHKSVLESIK